MIVVIRRTSATAPTPMPVVVVVPDDTPPFASPPKEEAFLERWRWTGTLHDLLSIIERSLELNGAEFLDSHPLPPLSVEGVDQGFNLAAHLIHIELEYIHRALRQTGGNQTAAARLLGLTFRGFRYRAAKLGVLHLYDTPSDSSETPEPGPDEGES